MGKKQNKNNDAVGSGGGGQGGGVKPPNVNAVPNRDIMQRMNFLWQASVYLENLGSSSGSRAPVMDEEVQEEKTKETTKRRRRERVVGVRDLAKVYIRTMKSVGQKTTTKM